MADEVAQDTILDENQPPLPEGMGDFDPSNMKMPSMDEILQMVESMEGISDEEREQLRRSILQPDSRQNPGHTSMEYLVFITMVSIILLCFVFFGYKLYKSLVEKERKREEKLKAKQAKKKK